MSFDEVIGQQEAKERLMQMVEEGRMPRWQSSWGVSVHSNR